MVRAAVRVAVTTLLVSGLARAPVLAASDAVHPDTARPEAAPIFHELTGAGFDFVHWNGMTGARYFAEMVGAGAALADFDDDGDLDLFLIQGTPLGDDRRVADAPAPPRHRPPFADRLYRNDLIGPAGGGDGGLRFTDVTAASGLGDHGYGMGVAAGDYDNDGRIDLYVAAFGDNSLLKNLGPGQDGTPRFEDVTDRARAQDRRWSVAAVFFDYDRDGWLDLYVGNYVDYRLATHKACRNAAGAEDYCGPHAYQPAADRLLRNRGPGDDGAVTFEDVTERAGLGAPGAGLGAVAADLDGNGWPDLYVANDGAPNQLWLNQGRDASGVVTFVDEALFAGCAVNVEGQPEASMGVDAGDVDGDGDLDLFMTHLVQESNTLYLNDGAARFRDASLKSGLATPSWSFTGFGTGFVDYDNDGWLDLLVVNGEVRMIEEQAKAGDPLPLRQSDLLFRNLGAGDDGDGGADGAGVRFADVTASAGPSFARLEVSRAAVFGDVDNDGDEDVLVTVNNGPAHLLLNGVGQDRHWLGLRLLTGDPGRDALGARVEVYPAGAAAPLVRRVATDGSYAAAHDPRVLVGLGVVAAPSRVDVVWPDGRRESFAGLATGRYHVLRQGTGKASP